MCINAQPLRPGLGLPEKASWRNSEIRKVGWVPPSVPRVEAGAQFAGILLPQSYWMGRGRMKEGLFPNPDTLASEENEYQKIRAEAKALLNAAFLRLG